MNRHAQLAAALEATQRARVRGEHRAGVAQAEVALALAEGLDVGEPLALALMALTHHRFALGRFADAMGSAERARAVWRALGDADHECESLCLRAAAGSEAGSDEEALHDAHCAFDLARAQRLPARLLQALALMGGFHGRLGDVGGAESLLLQALSRAREWHDHSARFLALNNLVSVLVQAHAEQAGRGDATVAAATAERLLRHARYSLTLTAEEPSRLRRAVLRSNAAAGLMASELNAEALPLLDDCLVQARSEGFRAVEIKARARLLQCLAQAGQDDDASHAAGDLGQLLAQGGSIHCTPAQQEAAAMLVALQGDGKRTAAASRLAALAVLARQTAGHLALQPALEDHVELVLAALATLDEGWRDVKPLPPGPGARAAAASSASAAMAPRAQEPLPAPR